MSERSEISRAWGHTRLALGLTSAQVSALFGVLAGALLGLLLLAPVASWADDLKSKPDPHFDGPAESPAFNSLRIGFGDPARDLADNAHTCGKSCFSLSPGAARNVPQLESAYTTRDLSLNLGQSGPVSLLFNGSRLRMHIRF